MLVTLEEIAKSFGTELIFEQINLTIEENDRIGFIGANGAGKTTLLSVLIGEAVPDAGNISKKSGLTIGYLKQNSGLTGGNSILEEMESVFADALAAQEKMTTLAERIATEPDNLTLQKEYSEALALFEARDGYNLGVNIRKVLRGMGFADKDDAMPVQSMSGGEKTRLALAKLLLMRPGLLVLDEPTNHLDFKTLAWLEGYLAEYKGAMLIVSHDRYFLDKVANKVWELEDYGVNEYKGNYSAFKVQKAEKLSHQMKEYKKQSNRMESMEEYARRNIARASTSKMAKSRLKQLSHMEPLKKPRMYAKVPSFAFEVRRQPVNDVLHVSDLTLQVGDGVTIANDIAFDVKRQESVALIGANGTGKSTLLRTLLSEPAKAKGEIGWGKNTEIGYYDQENKDMRPHNTAMEELWRRFPSLPENSVRSLLGRVLLTGDDAFKRVEVLSGGERAKLGLAILMAGEYNTLVLDEPTNHLDLPSREKLEGALQKYDGTLLFVSHDRYFVNALCDKVLELENGRLNEFEGSFDDFQAAKAENTVAEEPQEETAGQSKQSGQKDVRRQQAQRRQQAYKLEQKIAALEAEEKELEALIEENPSDFALLAEKCERLEQVKAEHERAAEEWLDIV